MNLGENIRARRESLGWTKVRLADACTLSVAAVCNFENGRIVPNAYTFDAIAKALGTTMDELMNGRQAKGGRA